MVAQTSILSYAIVKATGQNIKEKEYTIRLLKEAGIPLNSRQISKVSGIERTNVTRSLNDLHTAGLIEIAYYGRCPITKRLVQFYKIKGND